MNDISHNHRASKSLKKLDLDIFEKGYYVDQSRLNREVLKTMGFYSLRLKKNAALPNRYQIRLKEKKSRIIYIGKAQRQTLEKRLDQELKHTSPGTFFRSIGAVLGYTPIPGSLRNAKNKKNYKFSELDTLKIIEWLVESVEVCIVSYSGDFSIENQIIAQYSPLLNYTGNPQKCHELIEDRKRCREIATNKHV